MSPAAAPGGGYQWDDDVAREVGARKISAVHYLLEDAGAVQQRLFDAVWSAQRTALHELGGQAMAAGLHISVFKGAEVVERCFAPHGVDFLADVDLLVPRDELFDCKRLLAQLNYRPAYVEDGRGLVDLDLRDIAKIEG